MKFFRYVPVFLFIAFNISAFVVFDAVAIGAGGLATSIKAALDTAPMPAAGILIAGVVNSLVDPDTKARVVFWRWRHPLPGSRAFSEYGREDPRVNLTEIAARFGKLPSKPADQNRYWYGLYKKLREEKSEIIENSNFRYVVYRDLCVVSLLMTIMLCPSSFLFLSSLEVSLIYVAFMLIQFFALRVAAKNSGVRLVTNVLAYSP